LLSRPHDIDSRLHGYKPKKRSKPRAQIPVVAFEQVGTGR